MGISRRAFQIELFREHLEEASFLYGQLKSLRRNPEISWRTAADFEARLEAYVDALVVGGDLALETCGVRSREGDAGELFAAVCVFCRQRRSELVSPALRGAGEKPARGAAIADALKYELPANWSAYIERALAAPDPRLTSILAVVAGYRRLPVHGVLAGLLGQNPTGASAPLIEAIGRLRADAARAQLEACLKHPDDSIRSAAAGTLLRLGARETLQQCAVLSGTERWPRIALGLGAGQAASRVLQSIAASERADGDCLFGLGLLGDPAAMQTLYDTLKRPPLAESAALALCWITGAELEEEVFLPEEVTEDELFEDELQAWRERKEPPKRADGKPFGQTVKKLTPDKELWKRWFAENASRFDPKLRYRNGKPFTPDCLLENLANERSDHRLRKYAAEELAIRYGCDVPFEVDMPVTQQLRALQEISAWVEANAGRFQPGRWYFAGQPM